MVQQDPLLSFENVSFGYEGQLVLRNITFQVYPGEFIGIIGPNGGGKTTLLKLIMGFLKPSQGTIQIFGNTPTVSSQRIGYVPQHLNFDRQFPISVEELVLTGRLSHLPWYGMYSKEDKDAVTHALVKVGLTKFRYAAFGTLSSGQAQRALIARAIVGDPSLLLLDEPTASVDVQAESEIYSVLKSLQGSMTMLMVTHDLQTAIDQVQKVFCVQGTVMTLKPEEVCEHFAVGLYHKPLINFKQGE